MKSSRTNITLCSLIGFLNDIHSFRNGNALRKYDSILFVINRLLIVSIYTAGEVRDLLWTNSNIKLDWNEFIEFDALNYLFKTNPDKLIIPNF